MSEREKKIKEIGRQIPEIATLRKYVYGETGKTRANGEVVSPKRAIRTNDGLQKVAKKAVGWPVRERTKEDIPSKEACLTKETRLREGTSNVPRAGHVFCARNPLKTGSSNNTQEDDGDDNDNVMVNDPSFCFVVTHTKLVLEQLVFQHHIRLGLQADARTEDVGQGAALLGQGVDDGRPRGRERGLEHVAQDGEDAVEGFVFPFSFLSSLTVSVVVIGAGARRQPPLDAGHHLGDEHEVDNERGSEEGVFTDVEDSKYGIQRGF